MTWAKSPRSTAEPMTSSVATSSASATCCRMRRTSEPLWSGARVMSTAVDAAEMPILLPTSAVVK